MKTTECYECRKSIPLNDSCLYEREVYCKACLDRKVENGVEIEEYEVELQIDPTICVVCEMDNGDEELDLFKEQPVCDSCNKIIHNRPFPLWIKAAALLLAGVVIFGMIYNAKYFMAYSEMMQSNRAFEEGNLELAVTKMRRAEKRLPHIEDLEGAAELYEGMAQFSSGNSLEALAFFESFKALFPGDTSIDPWILRAKAGIAFDEGDYTKFYLRQTELFELFEDDVEFIAGVASAASCLYVTTGDQSYLTEMNKYIQLAESKSSPDTERFLKDYLQRVRYRIYSSSIISAEEYYEKYPEGWKGELK